MKKLYLILSLICLSLSINLHSLDGWFWLNPLPQGNSYIDVEFTSNNTVYVSAAGNTLMKSTDGGTTFVVMANKECGGTLTFINDITGFSSSSGGILKTTNGGNNWRYISAPVDYVHNFSSTPQTILYGLKDNKVYISSDLGESWSLSLSAYPNNTFFSVQFPSNNIGFVVGYKPTLFNYGRIHKTTNGGINWDTISTNFRYRSRGIYFLNENTGFIQTDQYRQLILKTTNSGMSWDTVCNLQNQYQQFRFFDNNNGFLQGHQEIMITTNQGMDWFNVVTVHTAYLKNINEGLGIGALNNYNFLYKTTDKGANWTSITTGFNDVLLDITFLNSLTGFTVGDNKIYKTTNSGINWAVTNLNIQSGFSNVENIMFPNENTGYAGIDGGRVAKTTNCGLNWEVFETNQFDHLHGMSFPSVDTGYAVTKYGNFIKTTNAGINWVVDSRFIVEDYEDVQFINNLTGFAGGSTNQPDIGIVRKTSDGGMNWEPILLDSIITVVDVCVSSPANWFVAGYGQSNLGYPGYIYYTTDFGANWNYHKFTNSIHSIHFASPQIGYASSYYNIMYKTTDAGITWFSTYCINDNTSQGIYFIDNFTGFASSRYGQIIKTTTGGGVLISVEPQSYIVPHTFNLYQNYPNPFNPITKIKFDIPKAMNASLKIYDILGREVSVIVNDFLIPGTYAFDFDGSNFSSGVYFYVLTGEGFVESKKMLLVK